MRSYSNWLMLACLSVGACSGDDAATDSEDAVTAADAATDDKASDSDKKSSGSAGKSSKDKASGGAGAKAASGSADMKSGSKDDDSKSDDSKKDGASEGEGKKDGESGEPNKEQTPADKGEGSPDGSEGETKSEESKTAPTNGDQLSLCSMVEGDCNKGFACQGPATSTLSPGRGYCSKICESDADCSGLTPEGTKYTCSTGGGTHSCQIACSSAEDKSCPSGLSCVQTGLRRPTSGAAGAGGQAGSAAPEAVFQCRYPFEVSKTWGACGDSTHVCEPNSRCTGFWFGAGHCTHSCESDADCEKPESGSAKATCWTLVPALGDNPPVKQCALSCTDAKDGCPNDLACIEGRRAPAADGMESAPAPAWCQ